MQSGSTPTSRSPFLWIILLQATVATLGSLYFSNYGDIVANIASGNWFGTGGGGYDPCHLCWWARIAMYTMVPMSLVAVITRDNTVGKYTLVQSLIGIAITSYHLYIINQPVNPFAMSCSADNPCTITIWKYGFLTIPLLAFIAFVVIFIASVFLTLRKR